MTHCQEIYKKTKISISHNLSGELKNYLSSCYDNYNNLLQLSNLGIYDCLMQDIASNVHAERIIKNLFIFAINDRKNHNDCYNTHLFEHSYKNYDQNLKEIQSFHQWCQSCDVEQNL